MASFASLPWELKERILTPVIADYGPQTRKPLALVPSTSAITAPAPGQANARRAIRLASVDREMRRSVFALVARWRGQAARMYAEIHAEECRARAALSDLKDLEDGKDVSKEERERYLEAFQDQWCLEWARAEAGVIWSPLSDVLGCLCQAASVGRNRSGWGQSCSVCTFAELTLGCLSWIRWRLEGVFLFHIQSQFLNPGHNKFALPGLRAPTMANFSSLPSEIKAEIVAHAVTVQYNYPFEHIAHYVPSLQDIKNICVSTLNANTCSRLASVNKELASHLHGTIKAWEHECRLPRHRLGFAWFEHKQNMRRLVKKLSESASEEDRKKYDEARWIESELRSLKSTVVWE